MQEQAVSTSPARNTDVFDVLLLLINHLRLLLVVPLVAGLAVLALTYALPRSYASAAIVGIPTGPTALITPQQAASLMVSPVVLDPVIEALRLSPGLPRDEARNALAERVKTSVGKDLLVRLEVVGSTPEQAQQTANAILSAWLKSTVPSEREKADLRQKLAHASASLANVQQALKRLVVDNPAAASPGGPKDGGLSLVAIGELGDRYLEQVLSIPRQMEGLSRDVIKQAPTLPTQAVRPRKAKIAVTAALATGALMLVLLLLRQMFDAAMQDPHKAEKVRRLRQALPRIARKSQGRVDE